MSGLSDISVSNYMKLEMKVGASAPIEILDIEGWGGLEDETNIVEVAQYNRKYARKLVGSSSIGAIELNCSFNPSTPSYKALADARAADAKAVFTVTYYNDASKTESSKRDFTAIVASYTESGEFDTQRTCTWTLAVDGALGPLVDGTAAPEA
ncbi:hypothetical protein [Vibrio fluvialis]|uniref:hypothetical protein n=1 Tax=Vibrio fluvialis TaxID=676 RepID=UPI0028DE1431|nr:hypothetical protein [Vibrio fluvialis]MDT8865859.1 hypothetical protein [Vibrio fluvialis]MDT8873627.1 hypothetical protein [Vibrio fluvialis]